MVADFGLLKRQLRAVITPLNRRTLIATQTPGIAVDQVDADLVRVRGGGTCFTVPKAWVRLLPITGTSTELLAGHLAADFADRLRATCASVQRLELTLAESPECSATAAAVLP
jgi:hypothetical protein